MALNHFRIRPNPEPPSHRPTPRLAKAALDDGHLWPTAFALTALTAAEEARIGALVKEAVS